MTDKSSTNKKHNTNFQDLTGQRFNHLLVLERVPNDKKTIWKCQCDCGKIVNVLASSLKSGQKSCGCMTKKILRDCQTIHGGSHTKLFDIWRNIKRRCYRENHKSYPQYGGRGIKVCDEWKNDFAAFQKWAFDNGYDENAEFMKCTIDRIDVDGDYKPDNCRWVDMKVQCNNRTNNRKLTYNNETHTISEWSEITHIPFDVIHSRIDKWHWTVEKALTTSNSRFERSLHKKVLDYLMENKTVNSKKASADLNMKNISSCISKLRNLGYEITSDITEIKDKKGRIEHRETVYTLMSTPEERRIENEK